MDLINCQQSILVQEIGGLIWLFQVGWDVQYVIPASSHGAVLDLLEQGLEIFGLAVKLYVECLDRSLIDLLSCVSRVINDSILNEHWSEGKVHWNLLCHLDKVGELVKKLVFEVATIVGLVLRAGLGEELIFERKEACLLPLFLRCAEEACDNSTYGAMPTGRTRALRRFDFLKL